jgi:hypothetical protein
MGGFTQDDSYVLGVVQTHDSELGWAQTSPLNI